MPYFDEATIYYYFTYSGKLMKWYWVNQSPITEWVCEGYVGDREEFIKELVDEVGEYFDYEGTSFKDNLRGVSLENLPENLRQYAAKLTEDRSELNSGHYDGSASLTNDNYLILDDYGNEIGYVVHIEDESDHIYFDGAGIRYFFRKTEDGGFEEVTNVEWSG